MQNIREQATDKQFLHAIANNDYIISDDIDYFEFAKALLPNFLSVDEELRDELSYMILASGIIEKEKLTTQQLEELLFIVLDQDHLFYRIGEVDNDSVFMRSFSNLIVAAILYIDARGKKFSAQVIKGAKSALLQYARKEKDWRGYVKGKGWAHTMAHLADALDVCARNAHMGAEDRREIMEVVRELARVPAALYHEEDMRLAIVVYHIIAGREVDDVFLSSWLASCFVQRDSDITSWRRVTNTKNFLRSLYFLLLWDSIAISLLDQISGILKRLDELYIEAKEEV